MSRIVKLSKYGFVLDSLKNDWENVDKSFLSSETFSALRKGMDISVTERNKSGFITNVSIVSPVKDCDVDVRQRDILKGQCLNIAFNSLRSDGYNLDTSQIIDKGVRLAHQLLVALEDADYYKW